MLFIKKKDDQPGEARPAVDANPAAPATDIAVPSMKASVQVPEREKQLQELKSRIHRKLINRLNLANLEKDSTEHREQIRPVLAELCEQEETLLDIRARQRVVEEVLNEVFGLGPLEELLRDPNVTEILVNSSKHIYIERSGMLMLTGATFR